MPSPLRGASGGRNASSISETRRAPPDCRPDLAPRRVVRRPVEQQVEQHGVVRLVLLGRMRPVAAPHHAVGRVLRRTPARPGRVAIGRRRRPALEIGAGELHPGAALVDQPLHDAERRIAGAGRLRQPADDDRTPSGTAGAARGRRPRRSGRRAGEAARASRAAFTRLASGSIMSSDVVGGAADRTG